MKIIDAIWERANIGSNVREICIEKGDSLSDVPSLEDMPDYDYIVVKVPVNMTDFNWYLGEHGFTMIETQIKLSKHIKNFDFGSRFLKRLLPFVSYKNVSTESELAAVIDRITPQMFITDRITLDSHYGPTVGCRRYQNYIRTSFESKTNTIIGIYFKDELVGFNMFQVVGNVCYGKLGGVFSSVNIPGIGYLIMCAPLLFANQEYGAEVFVPDISSNNIPVIRVYEYLGFHLEELTYVFVKHITKHK